MLAFLLASPALLATPCQEHLVSLGHGAFDSRWNDETYVSVCGGYDYSFARRSDGVVRVFGYPQLGPQTPPPGVFTTFTTSQGYWTSAGIKDDGTIVVWGGQTGLISSPPSLPAGVTYVQLDISDSFAGAVRSDGVAVGWGTNDLGRLNWPALPPGLAYTRVVVALYHTLLLRSDGALLGAGSADYGASHPPALPPGMSYIDVSTAFSHSVALRSDGRVIAFGNNDFQQLQVPALPPGTTYVSVRARQLSNAALRSDGVLVTWGNGGFGTHVPPPGQSFVQYSLGDGHLLILRSDGHIVTAGRNYRAQRNVASVPSGGHRVDIELGMSSAASSSPVLGARLADGSYEDLIDNRPPLEPPLGLAYVQIALARDSRIALRNDGQVEVNGLNSTTIPALPSGLVYTAVAAGGEHLLALRSDGALLAWGLNTSGQCNVPALPSGMNYVACAGGGAHSLALRSDGELVGFGGDYFGQCTVPALPPGVTYVEAWAGADFSLARRSDDVIVAFGRNDLGQCDVPSVPPSTRYQQIACGAAHVAALRSDGVIVLWGSGKAPAGELPALGGGLAYLEVAACGDETVARIGPATPTSGPVLTSLSPNVIEALIPGTAQSVTLSGTSLDTVTTVLVDGVPVDPSSWTTGGANQITLDMPQLSSLGGHVVGVSDGLATHELPVTLVAPLHAQLELGSGDPLNVIDRDNGLRVRIGGPVGKVQYLYGSDSNAPSSNAYVNLAMGNGFTQLFRGGSFVVPSRGWLEFIIPTASLPNPASSMTLYGQTILFLTPRPFPVSGLQSFVLVP